MNTIAGRDYEFVNNKEIVNTRIFERFLPKPSLLPINFNEPNDRYTDHFSPNKNISQGLNRQSMNDIRQVSRSRDILTSIPSRNNNEINQFTNLNKLKQYQGTVYYNDGNNFIPQLVQPRHNLRPHMNSFETPIISKSTDLRYNKNLQNFNSMNAGTLVEHIKNTYPQYVSTLINK